MTATIIVGAFPDGNSLKICNGTGLLGDRVPLDPLTRLVTIDGQSYFKSRRLPEFQHR
jgi:hypothetical protein